MLSAYIVRKSKGKYQGAAEAARGSWTRPLGVRVQKVQRVQRVQRVVVAANAANFIGCFAAVVGALKYGWAPLMIKPESRAFGAKGKQANRASPVEMHRGRGQKVGPIDRGVRRSIYVFA